MTIRVKLPNGEIGEFPAGMSNEDIEAVLQKQFPPEEMAEDSEIPSTPFNREEDQFSGTLQAPEKTGLSGVGSDFLHGLGNALQGARKFAGDIPENYEKASGYVKEHPVAAIPHMLGQIGAEGAEIGKELINSPYNLNQYLARKHLLLLPQVLGKWGKIIPHIPEDTGVEKALGLEADPEKGDALVRAVPDIASLVAGGTGLVKAGKRVFKAPDLKQALRDTQAKVNTADAKIGKVFDKVEQEVEQRGISKVPIDKDLIKTAKSLLADTDANRELIKLAKTGDYKALRKLQADLRVKGEKALSSILKAENDKGEKILEVRDKVNKSIQGHFEDTGHKDLAKDLNQARGDYKDIQKTYFSSPALAKVFGKSQKIPKNPKTLLTEESAEMKKFFEAHPELEKMTDKFLNHEGKMKALKTVLGVLGIGGTAGVTGHVLGKK